jgi:hypothetical protein
MESLNKKATRAAFSERHCRKCEYGVGHKICPFFGPCTDAFVRGYKKGYSKKTEEIKKQK